MRGPAGGASGVGRGLGVGVRQAVARVTGGAGSRAQPRVQALGIAALELVQATLTSHDDPHASRRATGRLEGRVAVTPLATQLDSRIRRLDPGGCKESRSQPARAAWANCGAGSGG